MHHLLLPPFQDVPVLGEIQVVPPRQACRPACGGSIWTAPALRALIGQERTRAGTRSALQSLHSFRGTPTHGT